MSRVLLLSAVLLGLAASPAPTEVPATSPTTPAAPVQAERLDAAIDEVLSRPEFRWRPGPRVRQQRAESPSWLGGFFEQLAEAIDGFFETLDSWLSRFGRWWRRLFGAEPQVSPRSAETGITLSWLLYGAALALVCVLAVLLWRRHRRRSLAETLEVEQLALEELAAEESAADQVEPRRWRQWALDLAAEGKLREAIRAAHLAALSELARGGLLRLERFKSNLDYLVELRRRSRTVPELPEFFAANVGVFERVWYGSAPASTQLLEAAMANVDRMADGAPPTA